MDQLMQTWRGRTVLGWGPCSPSPGVMVMDEPEMAMSGRPGAAGQPLLPPSRATGGHHCRVGRVVAMKRKGRDLRLQRAWACAYLRDVGTGGIACAVAMGLPWLFVSAVAMETGGGWEWGAAARATRMSPPPTPHEGATGLWFPRSSFLPFLKM